MADLKKFEEMLERLINEDKAGAEELFHEIVVEKSRDIYESLLEGDLDIDEDEDEEVDETTDEEVDESDEEVEESDDDLEEGFDLDEFEVEADPMGGDAADDMMSDLEGGDDEEEGEEGDEDEGGDMEDRVMDLEDALDDLKAEFEKMMSGEEGEPEMGDEEADDMGDMGDEGDEEADDMGDEEEPEESFQATITPMTAGEQMREYVEKVAPAKMGDNGQNTKSTVAGKNDMGGTTANIAKSGTESGVEANKGQLKGNGVFKGTPKEDNAGNVNVPGARGATKMASRPGHGAEKKGKPETASNKTPIVGK
jgi:hypothetical protein